MLKATDFPQDQMQVFNLLTGVMPDQPVTLSNVVSVGGDQRAGQPALRVYGPLEVYSARGDLEPRFSLGPQGLRWSTVALEVADSGGLRVGPLVIEGSLTVYGRIQGDFHQPFDGYITRYLRELRPGAIAIERLAVGGANAEQAELLHAAAPLQVRADSGTVASFLSYAVNWLQFNVRFSDVAPGTGWQGKRLTLDFDVDNLTPGTAGRISMQNGKVGIGTIPDIEGAFADLEERMRVLSLNVALVGRRLRQVERR